MPIDTHRTVTPQLVIGAFVALLGVILLLDRLDLVEARHLRLIWPIVLMAVGGSLLAQRSDSSGRFWGAAWTLVGVWMLFSMLGWIQVSIWQLIAPLVLIAVGTTVIMRAIGQETSWPHRRGARAPGGGSPGLHPPPPPGAPARGPESTPLRSERHGFVTLFTIMGQAKRASSDNPFRGGEMTAFMGGCVLDLRQATIAPGEAPVINLLAVMAGHEIWVPPGWVVSCEVVPLLGGIDDKRLPPLEPLPETAPRLRLKGVVLMSGVVIKTN
jgi:hypothetical protein